MSKTEINLFQTIKESLPSFIKEEFPLFGDLLEQYYISLEKKTGVYDILNRIDKNIKLDNITSTKRSTTLSRSHFSYETSIEVESTLGFPEKNGLIKINDEIIFYKEKTNDTFIDCYRGFSSVDSFGKVINFSDTTAQNHETFDEVINLYFLLVEEFLSQIKVQLLPGLETSEIVTDQNIFIKQSSDFYKSKGSEESFRILFSALFGFPAKIIKPQENVFEPSKSYYKVNTDLLVESITGDPLNTINRTIYQRSEDDDLKYGTVTDVQSIIRSGKQYYILSVDFGYDRDIINKGTLYGEFTYSKRTKVLEDTIFSSNNQYNSIYVDSTAGFPSSGIVQVKTPLGETFDVEYSQTNSNQFFVIDNRDLIIPKNSYLTTKDFAFVLYEDERIEMRICPIFSNEFEVDGNSLSLEKNDPVLISSIGEDVLDFRFNDWIFNHKIKTEVDFVEIQDFRSNKYKIKFYEKVDLYLQDEFTLISSDNVTYNLKLLSRINDLEYTFSSDRSINNIQTNGFYVERKLSKSSFTEEYNSIFSSIANVQNVYCDENKQDVYIHSGSIPNFGQNFIDIISRKLTFSGNYPEESETLFVGKHKLLTGDIVVYSEPSRVTEITTDEFGFVTEQVVPNTNILSLKNGRYFVKVIDRENIKLSSSLSKLFSNDFIKFSGNVSNNSLYTISSDWLDLSDLPGYVSNPSSFKINHQKLVKKITFPKNSSKEYSTNPGSIGIFKNGVEILNYKSKDSIFYGGINSIDVLSEGENYDVINLPELIIDDKVSGVEYGYGAYGTVEVTGSLKRVEIINSGVGFLNYPVIRIKGGNGFGAKIAPKFESKQYILEFDSKLVSLATNEIVFSSDVYFVNGEQIKYISGNNLSIGGLVNEGNYYVRKTGSNKIKLYANAQNSLENINEINLTSLGNSIHSIRALKNRNVIKKFDIVSEGFGYKNKKIFFDSSSLINKYDNTITIKNHKLSTNDVILYTNNQTPIGGLVSGNKYIVLKVNEDKIKLLDYNTKQLIFISSAGEGTNIIQDEPIEIEITNLDDNNNNTLVINPIFRGSITNVFMYSNGTKYGTDEIINYNRQPLIYAEPGNGCKLKPIIIDGKIQSIVIENGGSDYNSIPDIVIFSSTGKECKLIPVITDKKITDIIIENPGYDYKEDTYIEVISSGSGSNFLAKIDQWNVNIVEKEFSRRLITDDDGFLSKGKYGIKYSYCYVPRKLREYILTKRIESGVERYVPDLSLNESDNKEKDNIYHSPILGWAYDGNPIYGPYGFSNPNGTGEVRRMRSGYKLSPKINRPENLQLYPLGFFVEDYEYFDGFDLDIHNGRFCVTPEYPNGVYAYFCTIGDIDSQFKNYRKPQFPYIIGNTYKSDPIEFNFSNEVDQENFDYKEFFRNTSPYNLLKNRFEYDGLDLNSNILNHESLVNFVNKGSVDRIDIISAGNNYSVGDKIIFGKSSVNDVNVKANVDTIKGKEILSIGQTSTVIENVEILNTQFGSVAISTNPHNITGERSFGYYLDSSYRIETFFTKISNLVLTESLPNSSTTGITTYINVYGINAFPFIFENDIFTIDEEKVKILEVDSKASRLRILRSYEGTVGASHTYGTFLVEDSRKLYSNNKILSSETSFREREIYFNPVESIGIGTTSKTTLIIENPAIYSNSITIDPGVIYLRNHSLSTNDIITYKSNSNFPIRVRKDSSEFSLEENQDLYVYKYSEDLIGIYDEPIFISETGEFIGSERTPINLLTFVDYGLGNYHSFTKKNSNKFTLNKNSLIVQTTENHLLETGDTIDFDFSYNDDITIKIVYNEENRRFCANPVFFNSSSVDLENNSIIIENHGFVNDQKIIYTSSSPIQNLTNNGIYYISIIDNNSFCLKNNIGEIIEFGNQSFGNILPINPPILIEKNKSIIFDLSDQSLSYVRNNIRYSSFNFDVFLDSNFRNKLTSTTASSKFNVQKIGRIGIDLDAKLILEYDEEIPEKFYYKLSPIKNDDVPNYIFELIIDDESGISSIEYIDSKFKNNYKITKTSNLTFEIDLSEIPLENSLNFNYISSYTTNSTNTNGPINSIKFYSERKNINKIPYITGTNSENGSGFIGIVYSKDIGKVKELKIDDVSNELFSDLSLTPKATFPVSLKIEPLSSIEEIKIVNYGTNYSQYPDLVLIDGFTKKPVNDVVIQINENTSKVEVLKNTNGIYSVTPTIVPKNNTNGYRILSLEYDDFTKNVTVILDTVGFSTSSDFPFPIGTEFLLENVVTLNPETDLGYNSENYDYRLYTVIDNDPNIGGQLPSITFNMSDFSGNINPGIFDPLFTTARIVPATFFPTFDVKLKKNSFYIDEEVTQGEFKGIVLDWDADNEFLKVKTRNPQKIKLEEILTGNSSNSFGKISNIVGISTVKYQISYSRNISKGWLDNKGFLNNQNQNLHDSDYYQYFSYAVVSPVSSDKWDNLVQNVNHTAGFKRFSNLLVDSLPDNDFQYNVENEGYFFGVTNIDSEASLNCYYDYDLATENNIILKNDIISDEVRFNSRLLQDYFESIGNRVLVVDDISNDFNSNPRATRFSVVDEFNLDEVKFRKYFIHTVNNLFTSDRQSIIVNLIHDGSYGYLNQYGRVETTNPHGYFDFTVFNDNGYLLYYPIDYEFNDYNISGISLNIGEQLVGIGTTTLGDIVSIASTNVIIPSGSSSGVPIKVLTLPDTYRSSKLIVLLESNDGTFAQSNEFSILNAGFDAFYTEFASLETSNFGSDVSSGFATYYPLVNGSNLEFYVVPNSNPTQDYKLNILSTNISNDTLFTYDEVDLRTAKIQSTFKSILGSPVTSPGIVTSIASEYKTFYILASIEDTTNNIFEFSELIVVRNDSDLYFTDFGRVVSDSSVERTGIGTFSGEINGITNNTDIKFEPLPNRNIEIRSIIYAVELVDFNKILTSIDLDQANINILYGDYTGTENDIRRSFDLKYKGTPIFEREFDSEDTSIVSIVDNSLIIPNHFFVTGERIKYTYSSNSFIPNQPIGIVTTEISGVSTDKLPNELYAIKVNDSTLKFASTAENALKYNPIALEFSSLGIGTQHKLTAINPNVRGLFTIDNIIQSPIQETQVNVSLLNNLSATDNLIKLSGISSIFSNDIIKINNELMLVETVGISSNELIRVRRRWMGSELQTHSIGSTVTKYTGNYNIVGSTINFASAPYGKVPLSLPQNQVGTPYIRPDDRDFTGITTNSYFSGRVFLRTGEVDTSQEVYIDNYLFDNISEQFTGIRSEFTLTSNGSNVLGISTNNAIILIKDIFQQPEREGAFSITGNYRLYEDSGETKIQFNPSTQEINDDINVSGLPAGGIIISVGSTYGFGYQPLVSAGATAVISGFGSISQISIGNSGSGYRSGIQTVVNVYAQTSSSTIIVGVASIINGHVSGITITNPGTSYTSTNPPLIRIDEPLPYSDIPLVYSNSSAQGIGSGSKVDLIVSRDSSILEFKLSNNGYKYKEGEILTIDVGGISGIPTDPSKTYNEFQIFVNKIHNDEFSGWTIGDVQQLDPIDNLFNGIRRVFPLKYQGNRISIISRNGSNIDVESTLLIFINGILQDPGRSYTFKGGSLIVFDEAPKKEYTSNILFYRGTRDVDVSLVDLIEEVEPGDRVRLHSNSAFLTEEERLIEEIISADIVLTNSYAGPGISSDETLLRPVNICRQTEDIFINGTLTSKDRSIYEPLINPVTNIIQNVGSSSSEIFVESLKTFFDNGAEDLSFKELSEIDIISQDELLVGVATAIVSAAGSITSIDITNSGFGYTFIPSIAVANPPEYSSNGIPAEISLSILNGKIQSYTITNQGRGYDPQNPPEILIEYPKTYTENIINVDYEGDFGSIVGVSNTIVGASTTALSLDFYIDSQSFLRNPIINPDSLENGVSGISTGYFFVISNSNIGLGITSLYNNLNVLSETDIYFDNVFQVYDTKINSKEIIGIGTTSVLTVTTLIKSEFDITLPTFDNDIASFDSNIYKFDSNSKSFSYFGNFSWGRISFDIERSRRNRKEFNSYYLNGYSGLSTSAIVKRKRKLKSNLHLNFI